MCKKVWEAPFCCKKMWILDANQLEFQSHLCHMLAVWLYPSYLMVLKLNFLIGKMGKQLLLLGWMRPKGFHWYFKLISATVWPSAGSLDFWTPFSPNHGFKCCPRGPVWWHVVPLPVRESHQQPDLRKSRAGSQSPHKRAAPGRAGTVSQHPAASHWFSIQNLEFMVPPSSVTSSVRERHSRHGRGKS